MQKLRLSTDRKPQTPGTTLAEKAFAVFLYCHGLSMNAIAKMLHASHPLSSEWGRKFGAEHAYPPEPKETEAVVLELDEMWHYLKKSKNSGT